jgi:hypothetical protein
MVLKDTHDKLDEIPEEFQPLYTEKGGKWELTGIQGVKTQGDVDRVQESLRKSTNDQKELKTKLKTWDGMDHADVMTKLDRIPELEAASKGNLDEAGIEEIVNRRVDGTIKSRLAPVERKLKDTQKERDEYKDANVKFQAADKTRAIHDKVRKALVASKVLPDAHEDALLWADRIFELRDDDGAIVTRDAVGVTPGLDPVGWLDEIQDRRRHWWPESVGGGSRGSTGGAGGPGGKNPWTLDNWNLTEQGQIVRQTGGAERADRMAKAAGTSVGAGKPAPKRAAV